MSSKPAELLNKQTGEIVTVRSIVYEKDKVKIMIKVDGKTVDADDSLYSILTKDRIVYKIKNKKLVKFIIRTYA